jgi:peptidoglycan/xylan/chitin deacetylase (PgdA/CDA1 family)
MGKVPDEQPMPDEQPRRDEIRSDADTMPRMRDVEGYAGKPPVFEWPGGAALALSLVINDEEGSERDFATDGVNEGLGEIPYAFPANVADLCVESTYEYGGRAGIWRLLGILDDYQVPATMFAAAVALQRKPAVTAAIKAAGHEVCSHGWRWEEVWALEREEEREHIVRAVDLIRDCVGERPVGWYCRYGPSEATRELLVEEGGFLYDSDSYADDLPYFVDVKGTRHLVVPYSMLYNDIRFALGAGYGSPGDFAELCTRAIRELLREGRGGHPKMMSIGLHARWVGQAGRASALREIIEMALAEGDVWITTRREIAQWWTAKFR